MESLAIRAFEFHTLLKQSIRLQIPVIHIYDIDVIPVVNIMSGTA
jgi:hypothetical protein